MHKLLDTDTLGAYASGVFSFPRPVRVRTTNRAAGGPNAMPEFILDTRGEVGAALDTPHMDSMPERVGWGHLDSFTQGYIEAMFFTNEGPEDGQLGDAAFADLSPETLAAIIADCEKFQDDNGDALQTCDEADEGPDGNSRLYPRQAGRDFWYTRCGHGCGFWDGDWPEPHATALTAACEAFGNVDVYRGDDGKVYLS